MSPFQNAKLMLAGELGLAKDALHIYVGLALWLGVAALFRLSLRDPRPLAAVLLVTLAGELWDIVETVATGHRVRLGRGWHDLWNTLFWPTTLFVLARYTPLLKR